MPTPSTGISKNYWKRISFTGKAMRSIADGSSNEKCLSASCVNSDRMTALHEPLRTSVESGGA